jgi:hypothetical protein
MLRGAPLDATAAYTPSCSTRMTGFLRRLPLFAPRDVITTIGRPMISLPSAPPVASYFSTWPRTHSEALGR